MQPSTRLDVRDQQRALLKLERLKMRPMAKTLLSRNASRTAKLVAISGVAAFALSLAPISYAFSTRIGANADCVSQSTLAIAGAAGSCDRLTQLVAQNADASTVYAELETLFQIVDAEHSRLEKLARQAQAMLYHAGAAFQASGTGDKLPPNVSWLARALSSSGF